MGKKAKPLEERVTDLASLEMLGKAERECIDTSFSRMDSQQTQCTFGMNGTCCRICHMGPCRITKTAPRGVCGADGDTIVARNFLREVAGGGAAHSDHGRHLVLLLKKVTQGRGYGYQIKDETALRRSAQAYQIVEEGRTVNEVASDLAERLLEEFKAQETSLQTLRLAPKRRRAIWRANGVQPSGIDRMIVEAMHRTHIGVDHDYRNILMHAFRTSLADGWGGSRIASTVSDILFGTPVPVRSTTNLGVLGKSTVNIVVHGHEPELTELLAMAVKAPDVKRYVKQVGAEGITLAGICCTANEILMRQGVPVAGNFLQQELALITGAVEMMIIDVQCCMPSLPEIALAYHTEIVAISDMAKMIGATHLALDKKDPLSSVKYMVKRAIDNYLKRDSKKVDIPPIKESLAAGFGVEAIKCKLGGTLRPLVDAVIEGQILGIVGVVGCSNPKFKSEDYVNKLTSELIKHDILVLQTGCAAIASAKAGFMNPETAMEKAGVGLRDVCKGVGIPPVLHMGSCVDNSRILQIATELIFEGRLGNDLSQLPAAGVVPELMSEKAVAIGCYFVASGLNVILGQPFSTTGSENVTNFLFEESKDYFGASFHVCEDPYQATNMIIDILAKARRTLGIEEKRLAPIL
ncbi:MAG: anaerobic carbon-monoxide dehydrogenase catalytic subunit [Firmicutes bacterium]|nr:anaerobic carbon-monoxide dehydrogenase catalytic subunit [Bacillota bacterium]